MKRKYYLMVFILVIVKISFAQTTKFSGDSVKTKLRFLYIINSHDKAPTTTENAFIAPSQKDSTYRLQSSLCDEICTLLKINGIIVIKIKRGVNLMTLNEVFELFNVQNKFRRSKIIIDDDVIFFPETILISREVIDKLTIVKSGNNYSIKIFLKGYIQRKESERDGDYRKL